MIGYRIRYQELKKLIEAERPGWMVRAANRTATFAIAGKYDEASSIWSEIKVVYMRLQGGSKCAFCERKLEAEEHGAGEQDVEHFRPKGRVTDWIPVSTVLPVGTMLTSGSGSGYHLLAYHLYNYSATCKPCNASLKRDQFPITGVRNLLGTEPSQMGGECPLLIYPIGTIDSDPEALIGFLGTSPTALKKKGFKRLRALATIEFFQLADPIKRKNLFRDRALIIVALHPLLIKASKKSGPDVIQAKETVKAFCSDGAPHANCARSYVALYHSDANQAKIFHQNALAMICASS